MANDPGPPPTPSSEEEEDALYECRHCPGLQLREEEKAAHRAEHLRNRAMSVVSQAPSASSTSSDTFVLPPLARTAYEAIAEITRDMERKAEEKAAKETKAKRRKKRSIKKYDPYVKWSKNISG